MGLDGFRRKLRSRFLAEAEFKRNSSMAQSREGKNGTATCSQLGKVCRCLMTAGVCGDRLLITRQLHRLHGGRFQTTAVKIRQTGKGLKITVI